MRIALAQMTSTDDREANLRKVKDFALTAANQNAQLLALPENFSYLRREGEPYPFKESLDGELMDFLRSLALKHKLYILAGSFPEQIENSDKTYNTSVMLSSEGETLAVYRKIHLFDVELDEKNSFQESSLVEAGSRSVTVNTPWGCFGMAICYDLRFPELFRTLTERGATLIFIPSAFVDKTGAKHWEVLLRARAIENQVYIAAPDQFGRHSPTRISYGDSMLVDPWGAVIARAKDREELITCDIDFSYLDEVRKKLPALKHKKSYS